jgi:hypothetical protein
MSSSVSGSGVFRSAASALLPATPGRALARRTSMIRRAPNSDRLAAEPRSVSQSAARSMKYTSRSVKPALRARARTASAASPASSGSSPEIR